MAAERRSHAKENRRRSLQSVGESFDIPFLIILLLLLAVGLLMLYSASYAQSEYDTGYTLSTRYLQKQGVCAVIGLVAMAVLYCVPTSFWLKMAWPIYGVSIVDRKSVV